MKNQLTNNKGRIKSVSYAKWGYLFILPFFIVYIAFTLIPQFLTIYNSFFENYYVDLTQVGPNFVGLRNYIELFKPDLNGSILILKYAGNTAILWILGAVPQFVIAMLLAVFFTSGRLNIKFQGVFKTIIYMPNLIMAAAFSMLIFTIFSKVGPIQLLLEKWGWIDETFDFFAYRVSVRGLVAFMNFIMWFGNTTIVLMAGIMGIDQSIFESATIDGANALQVFFRVTFPLLLPIFVYCFITAMIGGIQMFDVPQVLTKGDGLPNGTTRTIVMYLNRYLGSKNYGMAGAISVILFIMTGTLGGIVYKMLSAQYKDPNAKHRDRKGKVI